VAEELGSLAVKIGLDSSGFQNGISSINRNLRVLDSEFKANTAALGENAKGLEGLKLKSESLSKQLELQKQKVGTLEQAYTKSAETKGKDSKATQDLEIKLNKAKQALSQMENELSKANKEIELQSSKWGTLGKSFDTIENKIKPIGQSISGVGQKLTLGITTPLIGIGTAAVKTGMDFEAEMSRVSAISGATGSDFKKLNDLALKLGADTAFSAGQAAEGMENLASAGFNTNEIMEAMPGMLDLAAAGGVEISEASDVAASALRGFGLEAGQSGHVADVLAQAASATNAGISDMGSALKYAAPPAHALGLNIEEVSAAIGIMSNAGIKGETAGTTLRGALTRLASPSKEAAALMEQLGFHAFDNQGKMFSLSQIVANLQNSMKGLSDEEKQNAIATIFGQETMSGMLTLIQAGPKQLDDLTNSFKASDGAAKKMAGTMQNNLKGSIEQMKGSLETAGIKIEQSLAPHIKIIADGITELANKFSELSPAEQQFALVMAGIAIVIGPALVSIGNLIAAIGNISKAFGTVSTAIANLGGMSKILGTIFNPCVIGIGIAVLAGYEIYKHWDTIKQGANDLWIKLTTVFQGIKTSITNAWENVKTATLTAWENLKSTISNGLNSIKSFLEPALNFYKTIFKNAWDIIKNIVLGAVLIILDIVTGNFTKLKSDIENIWNNIKTALTNIWETIKNTAVNAWTKLKETVINLCNNIKETVLNIWNSILTWFSELPGKLYSYGSSMFTRMKDGVNSTIGTVRSSIESGINNALSYLASLPGKAWSYGADFVNGIVNGIRSAVGRVEDAVSALAAKIRNYLHFSVPDEGPLTDYEKWMPDFMAGLAEGINKSKHIVAEAVNGLSLDMKVNSNIAEMAVPYNNNLKENENISNKNGLTLYIENFNNYTEKDIEQLAYELEFYRQKISMGKGGV
jgi:TP901 family phage tail tape measure protein